MRIILSAAVFMLVAASSFAADAVPDGEYAVKVTPLASNKLKGTTQAYDDVLTIKGGKMTTKVSTQYGFPEGECKVTTVGTRKVVVCEMKDEKHGTNLFSIDMQAKMCAGTLKWSKMGEDGKPKTAEYQIKGTAK